MRVQGVMMQAILLDQAKIRRQLGFVNKIGRRKHTGMFGRNIVHCFIGTCWYVLAEHGSMFPGNYSDGFWDTIWYIFSETTASE